MTEPTRATGGGTGRRRDPARSLRGIGAGILTMQAIVVALGIPLVTQQGRHGVAVAVIAAIAVLLLVAAPSLRSVFGIGLATGLQVAAIGTGFLSVPVLFLAVLFAAIWGGWLWMWRSLGTAPPSGSAPAPRPGERSLDR